MVACRDGKRRCGLGTCRMNCDLRTGGPPRCLPARCSRISGCRADRQLHKLAIFEGVRTFPPLSAKCSRKYGFSCQQSFPPPRHPNLAVLDRRRRWRCPPSGNWAWTGPLLRTVKASSSRSTNGGSCSLKNPSCWRSTVGLRHRHCRPANPSPRCTSTQHPPNPTLPPRVCVEHELLSPQADVARPGAYRGAGFDRGAPT